MVATGDANGLERKNWSRRPSISSFTAISSLVAFKRLHDENALLDDLMAKIRRALNFNADVSLVTDLTNPAVKHLQIKPLGMRVLVRICRGDDRTESGLYLPVGAKERHQRVVSLRHRLKSIGLAAASDPLSN